MQAITNLILIRHADAPWQPSESRPLSAKGHAAANELATRLSPTIRLTAIYSSPSRRAVQTVAPLARCFDLPIQWIADVRERRLGDFGDMQFEGAVEKTWSDFGFSFPGGESNKDAQARAWHAIRALFRRHPFGTVAVGTHGNLLALILNRVDPEVQFEFWRALRFPEAVRLWSAAGRLRFEVLFTGSR